MTIITMIIITIITMMMMMMMMIIIITIIIIIIIIIAGRTLACRLVPLVEPVLSKCGDERVFHRALYAV